MRTEIAAVDPRLFEPRSSTSGARTALWVPDQLKSAITRPCRYKPGVNRTYEDLVAHYRRGRPTRRPSRARRARPNAVRLARRARRPRRVRSV